MQDFTSQQIKEKYKIIEKLGEGTYGLVYKCQEIKTKQYMALKKLKLDKSEDEGIPSTTIREIALLKKIQHPNIVGLRSIDYQLNEAKLYLVFEFIDSDLRKFLDHRSKIKQDLLPIEIKHIMYQLLSGMDYLHSKRIIHRDLKPQNLLITTNQQIKICDFGLARQFSLPLGKLTKDTATLYYRAPELMMGDDEYSVTIDMWAIGCIFGELYLRYPIFAGDSQLDMLFRFCEVFGAPNEQNYFGVSKLPEFKSTFPKCKPKGLKYLLGDVCQDEIAMDLMESLLNMDPNRRPLAQQALCHKFFDEVRDQYQY